MFQTELEKHRTFINELKDAAKNYDHVTVRAETKGVAIVTGPFRAVHFTVNRASKHLSVALYMDETFPGRNEYRVTNYAIAGVAR